MPWNPALRIFEPLPAIANCSAMIKTILKKIKNINDYIARLVIEMRFRVIFLIKESLGEIEDKILYGKK